jgi:hypothetical protein
MKRALSLVALAFAPLLAKSETVDLGTHGTLNISVPSGWTFSAQKAEENGYAVTLSAPGEVNGKCLLTLIYVPNPEAFTKERIQDEVLVAADQYVDASVEKKKVLRDFNVPNSFGYYCVFTDASLVGKPSEHDNFKVVGVGEIRFSDDLTSAVSLLADDEKGPEFKAMLAAISSIRVTRQK